MSSVSRVQLESWLRTIDVKCNRLLDIGGSQNEIKGRTMSWDVGDYVIHDLQIPHENKISPSLMFDLNYEIENLELLDSCDFDIAFMIEVLEYVWNPVQAFKTINKMMRMNGLLYLSSHFVYKCHPPEGLDCLRYTPFGIEKILSETGFSIIDKIDRISDTGLLSAFYQGDRMRGKTDVDDNVTGSLIKCVKIRNL